MKKSPSEAEFHRQRLIPENNGMSLWLDAIMLVEAWNKMDKIMRFHISTLLQYQANRRPRIL